jgi:hypothetical protein
MLRVRFLATLGTFAVLSGSVVGGLVLAGAPASAAPTPGPSATVAVPAPQKPTTVCTIASSAAGHITGLGVTKDGYVVVDGVNSDGFLLRILYLNSSCKRTSAQSYSGSGPRDPEDLAVASNGAIWVADIGDSSSPPDRSSIGVWKVTSKTSSKIYRFSYPNGAQNAAAMLLNGDGTPIFITKVASGPAKLYVPTGPLTTTPSPLKQAGTFQPQQTGTANKFGLPGQNWVTGAANSPDGKKVVIRTYSDAYEWDVTDGDVIGAITKGKPRITPVPDDQQGEAIAYTADGSSFLTVSNANGPTTMYKWKPTAAGKVSTAKPGVLAGNSGGSGGIKDWFKSLSLNQLMLLLGGIALFGLLLIVIGILGITRSRKVARDTAAREKAAGRSGAARTPAAVGAEGGVYGSARSSGGGSGGQYGTPRGREYGSSSGGGRYSGGQYSGDHQYGGGQYDGGQYGGAPEGGSGGQYGAPQGGQYGRPQSGGQPGVYGRPADPYADDQGAGRRPPRPDGR